jgi:hypothetical protein
MEDVRDILFWGRRGGEYNSVTRFVGFSPPSVKRVTSLQLVA